MILLRKIFSRLTLRILGAVALCTILAALLSIGLRTPRGTGTHETASATILSFPDSEDHLQSATDKMLAKGRAEEPARLQDIAPAAGQ